MSQAYYYLDIISILQYYCLDHLANASAPEKTQCAQSSADEKSSSSTGIKIMILFSYC